MRPLLPPYKPFAALLVAGTLIFASVGYARSPLSHPVRGVIESIDYTSQTLLLTDSKTHAHRSFSWTRSTRFRQDCGKAEPEALRAGAKVKGYYRRELGRLVLRELRWSASCSQLS
jgi:hypothetical protein